MSEAQTSDKVFVESMKRSTESTVFLVSSDTHHRFRVHIEP